MLKLKLRYSKTIKKFMYDNFLYQYDEKYYILRC